MFSKDDRFNDARKFLNGFRNIGYVSGVIRRITPELFYLQQTANENHMIPIHIPPNNTLPKWAQSELIPAKVECRVHGMRSKADGTRIAHLVMMGIEQANVLDMPPRDAWLIPVPQGAPESTFKPSEYGIPNSRNSNQIEIAGFIGGLFITRNPQAATGGGNGEKALMIMLQQHADPDRAIPVRYKSKLVDKIKDTLKIGYPILISGQYRMKVRPIDGAVPDPVTGIAPVRFEPYIEAEIPKVATHQSLKLIPEWAKELGMQKGGIQSRAGEARSGLIIQDQGIVVPPTPVLDNSDL